jgi:hypothetical protein
VNLYAVFPAAAASGGSSIHGTLRDATGRPWPAGPTPRRPSTEATPVASTARADGHTGGSVDPNEPARPVGGVGQDSQTRGLDAWRGPTGAPRGSGGSHGSPVVWPAAARTSTISWPDAILANDSVLREKDLAHAAGAEPRGDQVSAAQQFNRHLFVRRPVARALDDESVVRTISCFRLAALPAYTRPLLTGVAPSTLAVWRDFVWIPRSTGTGQPAAGAELLLRTRRSPRTMNVMSARTDSSASPVSVDRSEFSVVPRSESGHDLAYWLARSAEERLLAIEVQRLIVYGRPRAAARLQRILEVAELVSR